ncbi:VOC family protein [Flavobacterium selenitireducens]|uniref:VOC family protein n=1 Tax=Flavobacterium selenitireducens TaxID=2722704 RepID=UPI00168AAAF9|nr:VOC family protein [Flavobacterium selenitireducens]MBD3582147.1 glyoxalase [Flavobacterium selenitireducens]
MKTRMIWANLISRNLEVTSKFYSDLGFKQNGKHNSADLVSFSFGDSNFVINFFTESGLKMGKDGKWVDAKRENEVLFSLSADSREEVDQWVEKVKSAGATIFEAPQNFEQGYTFGFADPDGHKYNILYWPGM